MDVYRRRFRNGGKAFLTLPKTDGTSSRWREMSTALTAGSLPLGHAESATRGTVTPFNSPIADVSPRLGYVLKRCRFGGRMAVLVWTEKGPKQFGIRDGIPPTSLF